MRFEHSMFHSLEAWQMARERANNSDIVEGFWRLDMGEASMWNPRRAVDFTGMHPDVSFLSGAPPSGSAPDQPCARHRARASHCYHLRNRSSSWRPGGAQSAR